MKIRQPIVKDNYALIPLTQNKFAIIDTDDVVRISKYNWYALKDRNTYYACRHIAKSKKNQKAKTIMMHRIITNASKNTLVDHINNNGLDNRKINLRFCTNQQNGFNRIKQKNTSSQYRGVCWCNTYKRWIASIVRDKKVYRIGSYKNEIEAAEAYDKKAIELYGEFANLNLE
jgi:hypothetical protein